MSRPSPAELQQRFQAAVGLLQSGRAVEARSQLVPVVMAAPGEPGVRQLMSQIAFALGDMVGAEREARAAAAAAPREPLLQSGLGDLLSRLRRAPEAESAYRAALALDPRFVPAVLGLTELWSQLGRFDEAVALLEPRAKSGDLQLVEALAAALKGAGRLDEALAAYTRVRDGRPGDGRAEHNLASVYADLWRDADALAAADRARAKGVDAPETWFIRARALQGLNRYGEADAAYREALRRRPDWIQALAELARLIWMRTGDLAAALDPLEDAVAAHPGSAPVDAQAALEISQLRHYAGDPAGAYAVLDAAVSRHPNSPTLKFAAAQAGARVAPETALRHAQAAAAQAPQDPRAVTALAEASLAAGDAAGVARAADQMLARDRDDQNAHALQAAAWRLAGDPRVEALYDYAAFVRPYTIAAPEGWPDLAAYLADLRDALLALHGLEAHPIGQSLRHGTQTSVNLMRSEAPAIQAFFKVIDAPIRRYMAEVGAGDDPLRRRNTGDYRLSGIWSVRLKPGGFHADHVHPQGWLSSAFYVDTPAAVDAGGREGWIKFGEPGLAHRPPLAPQHYVKPEPGRLVLFPSYMWHGTVPFSGETPRLTMAFDVVPA